MNHQSHESSPVAIIKEGAFGVLILETFILMLMESCIKNHGQNLIS